MQPPKKFPMKFPMKLILVQNALNKTSTGIVTVLCCSYIYTATCLDYLLLHNKYAGYANTAALAAAWESSGGEGRGGKGRWGLRGCTLKACHIGTA